MGGKGSRQLQGPGGHSGQVIPVICKNLGAVELYPFNDTGITVLIFVFQGDSSDLFQRGVDPVLIVVGDPVFPAVGGRNPGDPVDQVILGFKGNVIQQILRFHQTAHGVVFVGNRRRAVKGFPDEPFFIIVAVGYRIAVSVGGAGRQSGLQIKGISCERAAANGYAGVVSIAVISKGIAEAVMGNGGKPVILIAIARCGTAGGNRGHPVQAVVGIGDALSIAAYCNFIICAISLCNQCVFFLIMRLQFTEVKYILIFFELG